MPKQNVLLQAMNRGVISKKALGRVDLKRTALSAEIQNNYMPLSLGSMMLRCGTEYIDSTYSDKTALHIPFIFSVDDTAIIEITDMIMRVRVDEAVISRTAVSTAVTNGNFDTDIASWTDEDETGAVSQWESGYMSLTGTGFARAIRTQQVTVAGGDVGVEHALTIIVGQPDYTVTAQNGSVMLRVGSTSGGEEYIAETELRAGTHSLAFTPTGNFYIYFSNVKQPRALIASVNIASAGDMRITVPWAEADLDYIRYIQSGDVFFTAADGVRQYRIERHATRSWSAVLYLPEDGPFLAANTSTIHLTPSDLNGDITLTASAALFKSTQAGSLFRIASVGQTADVSLTGDDQYSTPSIRVTGVGATRDFTITIANVWTGTLTLQRSIDEEGTWVDVTTYIANTTATYSDGLDNQIAFYRLGFKTGGWASGTADVTLSYASGSLTGIVRITRVLGTTSAYASVLKPLGSLTASSDWSEGQWSDYRGYPSASTLDEGRLWWAGRDKIIGSVSDGFESFDDTVEGDSGPINRSIGEGPVDRINWLLPLQRLMVGCEMAERSCRSSSLDEILTPTNFNLKAPSTRGSSAVSPVKVDSNGLFVRLNRLFELAYNETYSSTADYAGTDLTILCPQIGAKKFTRLAVQRYPDTRVHCVRSDGRVAVLILDKAEDIKCWVTVETDGDVEDVFTLPAEVDQTEDKVYYLVKRTVNGLTKRFLERWSFEEESSGGTLTYDSDSTTTITAALDGRGGTVSISDAFLDGTVVTLRDSSGTKIGLNLTVTDGALTLASAVSFATITPSLYKHSDSHVVYSGVATTTFTAAHLANETVVIWGDGKDLGEFTLNASGVVTIPSVETYCGGLAYTARFKSAKLAYAAQDGTALTKRKRVDQLGLLLVDTHNDGLTYGGDFDHLDSLPRMEQEVEVDDDYIWGSYDFDTTEFNDDWTTDSRLCLQSEAPKPCTVLACVIEMETVG